jgi:hypothetical protein
MSEYPLRQAKDLFPDIIAYHVIMTSGSGETDPKLRWAVNHWRYMTTSNTLRDEINVENDLYDLNILSSLRNQVSNKKAKSKHIATELIVEIRHGKKLNKSRNLKALIDTGSSGCIHHKKMRTPNSG